MFVHGLPFGGPPATAATTLDLKLPDYQLVNISAGVEMAEGLEIVAYINNLFDENALLSFDRGRGGRARLAEDVRPDGAQGLLKPLTGKAVAGTLRPSSLGEGAWPK